MLAPSHNQKFLSYITRKHNQRSKSLILSFAQDSTLVCIADLRKLGWLTVLGWQAFVASVGYLNGAMTQGLIILTDPTYEPHHWHTVMLYWGVILFGVLVNTVVSSWLPKFESLILILHVVGFFAILFPLIILGPHTQPSQVF